MWCFACFSVFCFIECYIKWINGKYCLTYHTMGVKNATREKYRPRRRKIVYSKKRRLGSLQEVIECVCRREWQTSSVKRDAKEQTRRADRGGTQLLLPHLLAAPFSYGWNSDFTETWSRSAESDSDSESGPTTASLLASTYYQSWSKPTGQTYLFDQYFLTWDYIENVLKFHLIS